MFRRTDCLQIPVSELEAGLAFYRNQLGHELVWQTPTAAGRRMPESDAEIVVQTERTELEVNLTVISVDEAAAAIGRSGGRVIVEAFDIQSADAQWPKIQG